MGIFFIKICYNNLDEMKIDERTILMILRGRACERNIPIFKYNASWGNAMRTDIGLNKIIKISFQVKKVTYASQLKLYACFKFRCEIRKPRSERFNLTMRKALSPFSYLTLKTWQLKSLPITG